MSEKDNDKEDFNLDDLDGLIKKDNAEKKLATALGILVGCVLLMIVHNTYSMVKMWLDDSVVFVQCPRQFDLDRPVILSKMKNATPLALDNWIRSFAINYSQKLFPRVPNDVEPFFQYIANHSSGQIRNNYESRLEKAKEIKTAVESGKFSKFYLHNSNKIQIRKISGENETSWRVIINGYLHKRSGMRIEKTQPRLEMTIRAVTPTMTNPEGLIVDEFTFKYIIDPISGKEVEI